MSGYMGNGPGRGQRQAFSFTATASQTTFSGLDSVGLTLTYKPGFIDVYVNGLCIPPAEYTATDGSSIVFGFGLNASDVVYVVALSAFDVANTLAKDQDGADISNKPNFRNNLGLKTAAVADILGTVVQSAGVPTGSIVERGSNADGEYVKFADGTLICTKRLTTTGAISTTYGSMFVRSGISAGNYAAPFAAIPTVSAIPEQTSPGYRFIGFDDSISTTAWPQFGLVDAVSRGSTTTTINFIAIGRWF